MIREENQKIKFLDEVDRFDLEQGILACWNMVDDVKILGEGVMDRGMSEDELANFLIGLQAIYTLKFEKLFQTFETLIANKKIL